MKGLILAAVMAVGFGLQAVLFPMFGVRWLTPDFLLCAVVAIAQCDGFFSAALFGMIGGVVIDLLFGGIAGYNALLYLLVGLVIGYFFRTRGNINVLATAFITLVASLAKEILGMGIVYLSGIRFSVSAALVGHILPTMLLSGAFAFIIYPVLYRIYTAQCMRRHPRRYWMD